MNSNQNSQNNQQTVPKMDAQKGYSLLQGLLILAIIGIVSTIVLNYLK